MGELPPSIPSARSRTRARRVDTGGGAGAVNPGAAAWFRDSAGHLIERVAGYLLVLDAHGVRHERRESADPGRIVYQDEYQVVAVPRG